MCAGIHFEGSRYPFKISVNDPEVMHILQAVRNVHKLRIGSVGNLLRSNVDTHKGDAVCIGVFPNELADVSIVHPLGNHRKPVLADCHSKER